MKMVNNLIFHYIFYCTTQLLATVKIAPLHQIKERIFGGLIHQFSPIRPNYNTLAL